jgi:phospholipid/cholesterol/gamma-HCH transport system permease protein
MADSETGHIPPTLSSTRSGDSVRVTLAGSWTLQDERPSAEEVRARLSDEAGIRSLEFDAQAITSWDSGLLIFLRRVLATATEAGFEIDRAGLPEGARRLLDLADAVPEKKGTGKESAPTSFLSRLGSATLDVTDGALEGTRFLGAASQAMVRLFRGQARFRRSDLMLILQDCGAQALPIVTLISFLVGLILAFVGAVQLEQFGAEIFVADLVGIGMARSMGAMMTGIIMAGRTGAAFAAQLGTMTVNEEIDALSTLGISPMEFLVLPRMIALMLMMPLLCLYADLMGMLGGLVVGVGMLDIRVVEYYEQTRAGVDLMDIGVGLINATVYGVLVAIAGCMRGMQCGRSAEAVGTATTSAVVTAIIWIVVATAVLTVIFNVLGI